jgi:predicted dithiol-disulfide oxidoreductase (DUF899 family)
MTTQPIVTREQWLEARKAHLAKEKDLTRQRDELARQRRQLPWVKLDQTYTFDTAHGTVTLSDLFRDKSQLIVYHFMFGPTWAEGCPSCSYVSDHLNATLPHLAARDTSLAVVSRAPIAKIDAFKKRMGWRFPWVSSAANSFNHDFGVSFTPDQTATGAVPYNYTTQPFPSEEAPGASVFYKDPVTNEIFHTYSTYSRGLDPLLGTYVLLDLTPKGRDEDNLPFGMHWVRHHDKYQSTAPFADPDKPYWPKNPATAAAVTTLESPSCCCGSGTTK